MANVKGNEFLKLTDYKTQEPIFLDSSEIVLIQQLDACDGTPRRTRIELVSSSQVFFVSEDAIQVTLVSGRGFFGPSDATPSVQFSARQAP
jgi:hypothetical protein